MLEIKDAISKSEMKLEMEKKDAISKLEMKDAISKLEMEKKEQMHIFERNCIDAKYKRDMAELSQR